MTTTPAPATLPQVITYRPGPVEHHHGEYVHPSRRVVDGVWRYPSPETCGDQSPFGIWIGPADQEVLVCQGCGLDGT